MSNPLFRNVTLSALALTSAALAGCASMPDGTPESAQNGEAPLLAQMRIDHALPLISADQASEQMLGGRLDLATPEGLLDYDLHYRVSQGEFFKAIRDGEDDLDKARREVALQTIEQTLGSTLRLPAGPPVRLALTRLEQTRLGFRQDSDADRQKQSTQAELQWSPGPVDLQVQWSQPRTGTSSDGKVDCNLRAGVTLPAGFVPLAGDSVLEFSGQRCRGHVSARSSNQVELARWGAAWRWGEDNDSTLRFLHTESASPLVAAGAPMPNYELDLSHAQTLPGGWQAAATVSWLRQELPGYRHLATMAGDSTDWSADLALTRQLDLMAVTARWARAAERIWFATATRQVGRDRFSLALDFGAWLSRLWPRVESAMDVSWDWRRTREGDADGKVSWNMLIGW